MAYLMKNGIAYGAGSGGDSYTKDQTDTLLSGKLDKSGGTLTGAVSMGSHKITALSAGTADTDAVNKGQLDEATAHPANRRLELVNLGTFASGSEFQSWYSSSGFKADISSGKFEKALVGGYVTINNRRYYFAHPDYWLNSGDTECTTHHMLVIPAGNLARGPMNDTHTTTGAYIGSKMRSSDGTLKTAADIIRADFGAANILAHRGYFANAVTDGYESAGTWYDSDIDLMTERMLYGCDIFHNCIAGTSWALRDSNDKTQIKLFAERPDLIATRVHWWLRDVASSTFFALVYSDGRGTASGAAYSCGVRPAFAIC